MYGKLTLEKVFTAVTYLHIKKSVISLRDPTSCSITATIFSIIAM